MTQQHQHPRPKGAKFIRVGPESGHRPAALTPSESTQQMDADRERPGASGDDSGLHGPPDSRRPDSSG